MLTYRSFVNLEPCLGHSRDSDEDLPSMWRRLERQPQRSGVDPAEQVLMQEREARSRRKREETEVELEKIHSRIKFVLQEANVSKRYRGPRNLKFNPSIIDYIRLISLSSMHHSLLAACATLS